MLSHFFFTTAIAECILSTADLLYVQISTVHKISTVHQLSTVHFQLTSTHLVETLLLLLSSTTDQTSHFRMRLVLFPPKWSNEQDSLLRSELLCFLAKVLRLGLRKCDLLFSALGLLQYRMSYCIRSDTCHCCPAFDDVTTAEIINKLG
ncbi:hypothetical protein F511_02728 [Dorcoceras hygrometricum]|uniref:Uncharacterized protein n=1 Tax=Dorcoceras hygrometricum TaxID=472368 RepID=A0A2Z7A857_9LAMI|nr:hypothetical protein F511_02728 [Dorcoceras hygrometricum]